MSIALPKEVSGPSKKNPSKLIIFSSPKSGKTEALSRLENNLILDLENGSGFVSGLKINVLEEATKQGIKPIIALKQIIDTITDANTEKKGYVYKYISIDTVSALEDFYAPDLALKLYRNTPIGRNFQGDNVLELPQGAGYYWLRLAMNMILDELEALCETLIISGHTKDKLAEFNGKEVNQRGLDLVGKMPAILCSKSDAICYLYRKDNQTIANFKTAETLSVGARPEHLKNQEIVLLEMNEKGEFISHWDKIFVD
jgi:hypothetical protein